MRLRIDAWPPGSVCQLQRADGKQSICGEVVAAEPWHPLHCQHGAAKMRPHRLLQKALSRRLIFSGAHVDEERHIPELYDQVWDRKQKKYVPRVALMDVVASFPGMPAPFLIDVSIRSAAAERVAAHAGIAGMAAQRGEKEKWDRYGPAVRPCVFDSLGRPGFHARTYFRDLVSTAASCGLGSPHAQQGLQTALERAVVWGSADNMLRARGGQDVSAWTDHLRHS